MLRTDDGYVCVSDPGSDVPILEAKTLQCVHCGGHWMPKPGSGIVRGFCTNCNGPVCGRDCAGKCVPVEQLLENIEAGRELDFKPTRVNVPKLWTPAGV